MVILAGGKSSRMGRDKKYLTLKEDTFLQMVLEAAEKISNNIMISLGETTQVAQLKKTVEHPVYLDREKEKGPLFGLLSTVPHLANEIFAIMPVDSPLVNPAVYIMMTKYLGGYNGVVPKDTAGMEPLQGIYRKKEFIDSARINIPEGRTSVRETVLKIPKIRYIDKEEFRSVDPELLTFKNVNIPEDYRDLLRLLGGD